MLSTAAINTACKYSFETNLPVTPLRNVPVNKRLLAEFCLMQILHLCTGKSVCATNVGLFGEIGAIFVCCFRSSKLSD